MTYWLRRALPVLFLLLATGESAQAMIPALQLPAGRTLDWSYRAQPNPPLYRAGDLLIAIRPRRTSEDPVEIITTVSVSRPRPIMQGPQPISPPLTLRSGPTTDWAEHGLSVGQLDASGARFVMWQAFSGGAHCCFSIQLALPDGPNPIVVNLGDFDNEILHDIPTDVDGDGVTDFVLRDDRFLYAFASYAASFAPPQIWNVEGGRAVDVSAAPRYRPLFEEAYESTRSGCVDRSSGDRNGACAAFVAAAARLGRFESAWAEMLGGYERNPEYRFPRGCRVERAEGCPAGEEIVYIDFPTALRPFLERTGYLPR